MNTENSQRIIKAQSPAESTVAVPIDSANVNSATSRFNNIVEALKQGKMIALTIEATSNCNLSCQFCGMHSKAYDLDDGSDGKAARKSKGHMRLPLFLSFVEKMGGLPPLKVLYYHGHGEPLLNKNLEKMIEAAVSAGLTERTVIVSNGTLLTANRLVKLVEAGMNEIRVSLDVITPATYQRIKGEDMGAQVVENIRACLKEIRNSNLKVGFSIDCMRWRDKASELYAENRLIEETLSEEVKNTPGANIRWRDEFNWIEKMGHAQTVVFHQRKAACENPFYMLMVHTDGRVSACCGDSTLDLVVGDLKNVRSFKEIIEGAPLQDLRRALLKGDLKNYSICQRCDAGSVVDIELSKNREKLLPILDEIDKKHHCCPVKK